MECPDEFRVVGSSKRVNEQFKKKGKLWTILNACENNSVKRCLFAPIVHFHVLRIEEEHGCWCDWNVEVLFVDGDTINIDKKDPRHFSQKRRRLHELCYVRNKQCANKRCHQERDSPLLSQISAPQQDLLCIAEHDPLRACFAATATFQMRSCVSHHW